MFVRSLRLQGFKSFADPTVLTFEPGLNVIVGPNGSGKSNIADALGWVLGSQAPASLRGGSMEDVIFAGSQDRPRLGVATVELTIDNSSGALPLDLSEVTISRSTDRSGTSEYRINGAGCRLLDVTELLSDTGIGRNLHTLVGQGRLDAVLQARPEDRRALVEEAAQIGKYRRRKERTLRKIERVDDNLTRLEDVLTEVRRSVRPLRRQASAARAHSELLDEQRRLRQSLAATEVAELQEQERGLDVPGERHRASLLDEELAHTRALLGGAAEARAASATALERARDVRRRMARATERLEGLARVGAERSERVAARLAAETEEGYRGRIRLLRGELERWGAAAERLRADAREVEARADAAASSAGERRREMESAEAELAAARRRESEAAQALVRAEGGEAAGRATLGSLRARVEAIVERRAVAAQELERDEEHLAAAQAETAALAERLDGATEAAAAAEQRLELAWERAERCRSALAGDRERRAACRARLEALEEAAALLSDLPEAAARLRPLIDAARGAEEASAEAEGSGDEALAAASAEVERRAEEVARRDDDLRRLDALASGAAERLAGARRRRETRAVELASLDEELARAQDALARSETEVAEERAALPERRAAAVEAQARREETERGLARLRAAADRARSEAGELNLARRTAEERALAAQQRVEEAEAGIADARAGLEGIAELRNRLEAELHRAHRVAELAGLGATRGHAWLAAALAAETRAEQAATEAEHRLRGLSDRQRALEESLRDASENRTRLEVRSAELRARREALTERCMQEWGLGEQDLLAIEPLEEGAAQKARERVEDLERQIRRLGPVNPRAAEEYEEAAERERFLVEQIDDLKSSRRDLLRIAREVDAAIVEVFGEAYAAVAREFEAVFERVFPGGRGRLTLTDSDDLLTTGIDIEARPPGKNVKKLSLLSGGERSLVALAFLFSLFRALPSPFYLLDEVEAALDDINLQRFLTLVRDLNEHAQVMVVTHQKRTMEAADVLYGVTMASDGVSRVVAQRMQEAIAPAAAG